MLKHQWKNQKGTWFVNCIGVIYGTLFPLAFAPTVNGEDYYTRKGDYAIKGLVICDDAARLPGMKWDGRVVSTTIEYGQTVRYMWVEISISNRRSICLGIQHFQPQQ